MATYETLRGLYIWKDGNGSPGAEERLRRVEGVVERVKTGAACTAKDSLVEIKTDLKRLYKWFIFMTIFMCVIAGDRIFSLLALLK
jgi:hypothetical protein